MFPVSTSTFSLKFKTIFASSATSVALSEGLDELNDGFVLQETTRLQLFDPSVVSDQVQLP